MVLFLAKASPPTVSALGRGMSLGMFNPANLATCWTWGLKSAGNVDSSSWLVEPAGPLVR